MTDEARRVAMGLTKEQREAVMERRVHDCPYSHPIGTRCPNCSTWPFKKGGAAEFIATTRTILQETDNGRN